MYKILALDMDGTLLTGKKIITENTKKALKNLEKKGVKIVLASGRPVEGLRKYLEELNLIKDDDYVLSYNGALVQNAKTHEILSKIVLKGSDLKRIYEVSKKLNVNIHAFSVKQGLITPKNSKYTEHEANLNGLKINVVDFNEIDDDEDIIKVMMIDEPETLDAAIEKIPEDLKKDYSVFKSTPFFYEFINKNVNKGLGLKFLSEYLNVDRKNVVACGDAENDLSMIKFAGLGVAMENAEDIVKKNADFITLSNENEGIAKVIQEAF
ncbi:Cof-type HAD-IIB family hydrolase [Clostridium sp. BJN0001]|uniref:Cof-type HAD-IIB family hydrolase n=1 Tax=Clostridium sp. BJN0001 TaxID=2930219 RepID=UPI001FD52985|nr:Cof-type HAD-IIB family hydrolase [Clostridium sp. BJN0001]